MPLSASLRRADSKKFKQLGLVTVSHSKESRAGHSRADEFNSSVLPGWLSPYGHKVSAQLQASRSHMIRCRHEWNGSFSLHVSLLRKENISQKTPCWLPLESHWQDWVTFLCVGLMEGWESKYPALLDSRIGGGLCPWRMAVGRDPGVSARLPGWGVNITYQYGHSLRDDLAFCSTLNGPRLGLFLIS